MACASGAAQARQAACASAPPALTAAIARGMRWPTRVASLRGRGTCSAAWRDCLLSCVGVCFALRGCTLCMARALLDGPAAGVCEKRRFLIPKAKLHPSSAMAAPTMAAASGSSRKSTCAPAVWRYGCAPVTCPRPLSSPARHARAGQACVPPHGTRVIPQRRSHMPLKTRPLPVSQEVIQGGTVVPRSSTVTCDPNSEKLRTAARCVSDATAPASPRLVPQGGFAAHARTSGPSQIQSDRHQPPPCAAAAS